VSGRGEDQAVTDDAPERISLPLAPGDVCLQAHVNGAIVLVDDRHQWRFVTLAQAVEAAERARDASARVLLAHEASHPMVEPVLAAIRATGVDVADWGTVIPPFRWPNETTALMTAAAGGDHAVLDDLLARGVDVDHRDVKGSTALHHAAAAGDDRAIRFLLAAGSSPDATDHEGLRPAEVAAINGHGAVAGRLDAGPGSSEVASYRIRHWVPVWFFVYFTALCAVLAGFMAVEVFELGRTGGIVAALGGALISFSLHVTHAMFWRGAVVRRLEGDELVGRALTGREVRLDLASARAAAFGVSGSHRAVSAVAMGRYLVVVVDEGGRPATARALRRAGFVPGDVEAILAAGPQVVSFIVNHGPREEVLATAGWCLVRARAVMPAATRQEIARARAGVTDGFGWR
jgi:hypothetical protein